MSNDETLWTRRLLIVPRVNRKPQFHVPSGRVYNINTGRAGLYLASNIVAAMVISKGYSRSYSRS